MDQLNLVQPAAVTPKVFIFAMFDEEARIWLSKDSAFDFSHKIYIPGLSRGYEHVHCTTDYAVCLLVMGTALVNAALSAQTLASSNKFDLTETYFILTGIAGVNPKIATIGTVAFARYVIQVDTQLEFDGREIPSSWKTGYVPMGADRHDGFPQNIHGSEVYELNDDLRQTAVSFSRNATLEDTEAAQTHRSDYLRFPNGIYDAATKPPDIIYGDIASSNVFWHGRLISEGMEDVFKTYTTSKAQYVMTAQEDTAILTALLRAALQQKVDFSRIIATRAGSNFDRGPEEHERPQLPFVLDRGGLGSSLRNLYLTGVEVVKGILENWDNRFKGGVKAPNYVGDIYGSLGGTPDFIPGDATL